jgi:hypothetical protein
MRAIKLTSPRCIALIAVLFLPSAVLPQSDFAIDWFAVASGGGNSSGGDFELISTIGQPDAGDLLGGDFGITGGFWSIAQVVEAPIAIFLSVSLSGGNAIISWPESGSAGFDLQETSALVGTVWTGVNTPPEVTNGLKTVRLPLAAGNRFYRLHKP